ncbi:MAG: hypothetical protein J0651_03580, partial [Actinobacteria bacterium]|nr:hypothetical protein [Actinomycetota bacterium]
MNSNDAVQTARGIYVDSGQVLAPPNTLVTAGFLNGMRYSMTVWTLMLQQQNLLLDRRGSNSFIVRWRLILIGGKNVMRLRISNATGDYYADGTVDIPINKWVLLTVVINCSSGTNCVITGYNSLSVVDSATLPVA